MSLTPTKFTWVSGPGSVKVKGDWDSWKEEIELNKKEDGSFERQIPLPENKRVHFKYIVDGNWVTKESDPTVNDDGNVNNTIDVGPAPKAEKLSEGVTAAAAGVGAAAAGAGAAAVAAVKGSENGQSASATQTSTDKKAAPAQPVKEVANADIRNYLPHSLTTATHAARPVLASTIATVTGADILRGNPEELPVSNAEAQAVQSQATKEPSSVGNAITNASKADTSNAKAGASTATAGALNSKLDAPAVAVTDAGHAANVDAARLSAGKEGGVAAGAIASAGISTTNGSASAASDKAAANAPAPASSTKADAVAAAPPSTANAPAPASSTKTDAVAAAPPSAANAPAPASSTKAAAVAAAPAAGVAAASAAPASSKASNGAAPALTPETSGVPAGAIPVSSQATNGASTANAEKTLPTAPAQAANGSTIKSGSNTTDNIPTKAPVAPTIPKKAGTVKDKKGTFRGHFKGDSETVGDTSTGSADGSRRKSSFFGKIKHALSPHSSPSK